MQSTGEIDRLDSILSEVVQHLDPKYRTAYNELLAHTKVLTRRLNGEMEIRIKTLTGRNLQLVVKDSDSVRTLKEMIHQKEGIPADQQRLVLDTGWPLLDDEKPLTECKVKEGMTVHLVLPFRTESTPPQRIRSSARVQRRLRRMLNEDESDDAEMGSRRLRRRITQLDQLEVEELLD